MKAITYTEYGPPDVLHLTEADKPAPKDAEVLIRVRAASVNPLDWHFMRGTPLLLRVIAGLRKPKVTRLGADVSGQVEAVGRTVTQFKVGDEVFGACRGSFAEYVCASEEKIALKPASLSFEDAAAVPVAALTALQGLRNKGRIQQGQKVLIDGASGGVGTFAVQIAKSFGAEVTAVCSTGKMDTARSIGADHVIDYTREDFTRSGKRYDLILGANAFRSIFDYRSVLTENGVFVSAGGNTRFPAMLEAMLLAPILSFLGRKKMGTFLANINKKDLDVLSVLLTQKKVVPVIDQRYPFRDAAEAIRYLEEGHARGKVVITFDRDD